MDPLWQFSPAENSIDFVGAIIFATVLYRALRRLCVNDLTQEGKILLSMLALISVLHIFQVIVQLLYGGPISLYGVTFKIWDTINFLTAYLFLMGVERIKRRESLSFKH